MYFKVDLQNISEDYETEEEKSRTLSSFTASMIVFVLPVPGGCRG